jgi:hypoxanthine phosphoribosyltransferase
MLAYRLGIRNILVAAVEYYDDEGQPGPKPTFLQFPADPLLRGQRVLIVDEVWDSGTTIHAVTERVRKGRPGSRRRSSCTTSRPSSCPPPDFTS